MSIESRIKWLRILMWSILVLCLFNWVVSSPYKEIISYIQLWFLCVQVWLAIGVFHDLRQKHKNDKIH